MKLERQCCNRKYCRHYVSKWNRILKRIMDLLAPVVDFMVHDFCRLYFKLSFLSAYTPLHFSVETCFILYTQSRIEDIRKQFLQPVLVSKVMGWRNLNTARHQEWAERAFSLKNGKASRWWKERKWNRRRLSVLLHYWRWSN